MRQALLLLAVLFSLTIAAQGKRLPNLTFKHGTVAFANANRQYNSEQQFTDTIYDERTLQGLIQIMEKNEKLVIEIAGHTSFNEDTLLGMSRAGVVRNHLIKNGIDASRMIIVNHGVSKAIISNEIIASLPTAIEMDAAHQKNRRVEISVIGLKEEE